MAIVLAGSAGGFVELEIGSSKESFARLLDSQQELFHSQVDQLQKLVVTQCKLTGVNPLSQEMAAGALSIKIGKRQRDLLNPKAIKYMQSIFSIKDTLGKRETRDISALCGVTATQVRDYFTGQRAKVRKLVRLSRDNTSRSDASRKYNVVGTLFPDQSLPASKDDALNPIDHRIVGDHPGNSEYNNSGACAQVPETSGNFNTAQVGEPVPVNSTLLNTIEEGPSCSAQEETIPGIDSDDKKFLENIFNLMRKEETFSGQAKLMEWVLQIHNSALLHWFLTKGGLTILATWLSQAAVEEQTTLLHAVFKVLSHLPLHKALPAQMSAILPTVNRLRFYRASDISNSAKTLLSRWSKLFVRSQFLKKPSLTNRKDAQKEMLRRQRISEILSDGSWQSKIDIPEEILALEGITDDSRPEPRKGQKLLQSSCDESSKNHSRRVSAPKTKVRRKVVLVEQPDRRASDRTVAVARVVPSNHSRPMSADDIQKAKMQASFMREKYGKTNPPTSDNPPQKTEECKPMPAPRTRIARLLPTRIPQPPQQRRDELEKPSELAAETLHQNLEMPTNSMLDSLSHERTWQTSGADTPDQNMEMPMNSKPNSIFQERLQDMPTNSKPNSNFLERLPEMPTNSKPNSIFQERLQEMPTSSKPNSIFQERLREKVMNRFKWQTPPAMRFDSSWRVGGGENSKELEIQTQRIRREKETIYPNILDIPPNPKDPWDSEMDYDDTLTPEIPTEQQPEADPSEGSSCSPRYRRGPEHGSPAAPPMSNEPPEPDLELLAVLLKNPELVFALTSEQGQVMSSHEKVALLDTLKKREIGLVGLEEKPMMPEPRSLPSPTPSDASRSGWRPPVLQPHFPVSTKSQAPALELPQAPTTILSTPHLTVTINAPKRPQASVLSSVYPVQQQQLPGGHVTHPSQPALLPTPSRQQPPLLADPPTYHSKTPAWTPDSRIGVARGILEVPGPNPYYPANQGDYSMYSKGRPHPSFVHPGLAVEINSGPGVPVLETWSPERSPVRSAEFRLGRPNFSGHRREVGRDHRPEWPRQWNHGRRDRDRSRDRSRDRDRNWPGGGSSRWRGRK